MSQASILGEPPLKANISFQWNTYTFLNPFLAPSKSHFSKNEATGHQNLNCSILILIGVSKDIGRKNDIFNHMRYFCLRVRLRGMLKVHTSFLCNCQIHCCEPKHAFQQWRGGGILWQLLRKGCSSSSSSSSWSKYEKEETGVHLTVPSYPPPSQVSVIIHPQQGLPRISSYRGIKEQLLNGRVERPLKVVLYYKARQSPHSTEQTYVPRCPCKKQTNKHKHARTHAHTQK